MITWIKKRTRQKIYRVLTFVFLIVFILIVVGSAIALVSFQTPK